MRRGHCRRPPKQRRASTTELVCSLHCLDREKRLLSGGSCRRRDFSRDSDPRRIVDADLDQVTHAVGADPLDSDRLDGRLAEEHREQRSEDDEACGNNSTA